MADAVTALPGGARFAALRAQVDGEPGAIGDLAARLIAAAGMTQDSHWAVARSSAEVARSWHGAAEESFTTYMTRSGSAADEVHSRLARCAAQLGDAATEVAEAKELLTAIASRILDTADRAHRVVAVSAASATIAHTDPTPQEVVALRPSTPVNLFEGFFRPST